MKIRPKIERIKYVLDNIAHGTKKLAGRRGGVERVRIYIRNSGRVEFQWGTDFVVVETIREYGSTGKPSKR